MRYNYFEENLFEYFSAGYSSISSFFFIFKQLTQKSIKKTIKIKWQNNIHFDNILESDFYCKT